MPTALSSETLVNTTTFGDQTPVGVAALANGRSVVAWIDEGVDSDVARVRLYGPTGEAVSAEITVAPATQAAVAGLTGGGFVVVWATLSNAPAAVRAQIYDASGQPVGAMQELAAYNIAGTPTLGLHLVGFEATGLADGGYVTGWSVQLADSSGRQSLSSQIVVADAQGVVEANSPFSVEFSNKQLSQYDPDISFVDVGGGHFLATWRDAPTFGPGLNDPGAQWAQLYDLTGHSLGAPVRLDPAFPPDGGPTINPIAGLSAAHTNTGDIAFAWNENGTVWVSFYPEDRLGMGISTNRTQPIAAGTGSTAEGEPQVALLSDGRLLVAWNGANGDVMGRIFSTLGTSRGTATGEAFSFGQTTSGVQDLIDVVVRPDGAIVAVWRDASGLGGDASGEGVKLQVLWPDAGGQVGTSGHDVLVGGAGSDLLIGGGGDDWLLGLGGSDTLVGGTGPDKFIITVDGAGDRIVDYEQGTDTLMLFDDAGRPVAGAQGLLVWDSVAHQLFWDADSDAGPASQQHLASIAGASGITRADFAAGFQPSGLRTMLSNGGHTDTVFDWSGQSFDTATATFVASGALKSYEVRFDTGAWSLRSNDVDNATPDWSTVVAEYDPKGQLFAYTVFHDDGSRTLWQYDTTNSKPWSRVLEEYDPLGRLSQQSAAMDDGTAWERHHDTYDTQPWAYYIDNFAGGRLLNHTFYKADGSVYVG